MMKREKPLSNMNTSLGIFYVIHRKIWLSFEYQGARWVTKRGKDADDVDAELDTPAFRRNLFPEGTVGIMRRGMLRKESND